MNCDCACECLEGLNDATTIHGDDVCTEQLANGHRKIYRSDFAYATDVIDPLTTEGR